MNVAKALSFEDFRILISPLKVYSF